MLLYKTFLKLRHRAYDKGRKKSSSSAIPSVCIGNVTVGGTGKTPHAEMLLRLLENKDGVCVLSRGYGRRTKGFLKVNPAEGNSKTFGDEPLQIARKFPERVVAVDADRIKGCEKLKELGQKIVLLDDAFQHRRLKANLNIVLVNYSRPVFEDRLLPLGRLRDLPERIFKADMIIVSKCPEDITDQEKSAFAQRLHLKDYSGAECSAINPEGQKQSLLFSTIEYLPSQMVFPEGDHRYTYSHKVMYMSGIAHDRRLQDHLRGQYDIVKCFEFGDHHDFTRSELASIEKDLRRTKACPLVTTEKDAQRLLSLPFVSDYLKERTFMVPIQARLTSPQEEKLLLRRLEELC